MPRFLASLVLLASLSAAADASAFAILRHYRYEPCQPFPCQGDVDVERTLREAPRWDARPPTSTIPSSLADGIDVHVAQGFGEALATGNDLGAADYEQAVLDAFAAWETPELAFDITLDAFPGLEMNVYAVDSSHTFFVGNNFSGVADVRTAFNNDRMLTNGTVEAGYRIWGANLYIAADRVQQAIAFWKVTGILTEADRLARFQNLMVHEIGHAIGLNHADELVELGLNFDSDLDPTTPVIVDPLAPWSGIGLSPNVDPDAIMNAGLRTNAFALTAVDLLPDDRSGRDVLYPSLPEAGTLALAAAILAAVRLHGRARRRP